jgi:hypothetical protein
MSVSEFPNYLKGLGRLVRRTVAPRRMNVLGSRWGKPATREGDYKSPRC